MTKQLLAALVGSIFLAPALSSACTNPGEPPAIPDPHTAVTAQMVKANNEVKAYVQSTEEYLGCAGLPRSQQKEQHAALEAYAEEFNVAIRTFKARQ